MIGGPLSNVFAESLVQSVGTQIGTEYVPRKCSRRTFEGGSTAMTRTPDFSSPTRIVMFPSK